MPIEFVCKIKFAEEDEKQKSKQDGDKESLIEESCTPPAKDLAGFANSCSLHGINHIFVSGRLGIRQTLWALAFFTSLALFLYQAAKCAISYLEHPHVTALNEEASPDMVFPAVTICNINRFRFSALTDADIYHLANLTGLPPKNRDGHKPTDLMYPAPDMQDIFNRTGHQLDEMLMSCNFSGQNCSAEDFSVVSETEPKVSPSSSIMRHPNFLGSLPCSVNAVTCQLQIRLNGKRTLYLSLCFYSSPGATRFPQCVCAHAEFMAAPRSLCSH